MTDPRDQGRSASRSPEAKRGPKVRDRDVLLLAAATVGLVLVANVVTGFVRPLDDLLNFAPVVVVLLIAVTALVLIRSLRRGAPGADEAASGPRDLE